MKDASREQDKESLSAWARAALRGAGTLAVVSAACVLAAIVGWGVPADESALLRAGTLAAAGGLFLREALFAFFRQDSVFRNFLRRRFEAGLFFAAGATSFGAGALRAGLENFFPETFGGGGSATGTALAAIAAGATLWAAALRGLRERRMFFRKLPLTPGRVFILSFVILVAAGTLLLKTPNASVGGISWCDALFLSTSAVCVTGLAPFDVARELTFSGQCILLTLIQLGGLGVMSITYFFAHFFAGGLSLKNRFDFQDLFSEENLGQIGTALVVIVGFTFTAEALGAVAIYFSAVDVPAATERPVFFAVFHSVSAFCNAGLSCAPGGLADARLAGNMGVISSVAAMCVVGGLGFPVIKNFWMFLADRLRARLRRRSVGRVPVRLTTHTKIVIATSFALFVFGFAAFWLLGGGGEGGNADSLRRAFFLAGAARTSGFEIEPTAGVPAAAKLILMALMFIGGSPFSTAGGIKTTTFAVAVLSLRQLVLGRRDLEVFGRRLGGDIANQALAIVLLASSLVFVVAVALSVLHPEMSFLPLLFESVSAVGTVGLSCDVTPQLCDAAKCLVAAAMFIGRIGVLLFITSFLPRRKSPGPARLPETSIVLT